MQETSPEITLADLGWQSFFAEQVKSEEMDVMPPVRVMAVHRSGLHIMGDGIDMHIGPRRDATVGDWLQLDWTDMDASPLLTRKSLIKRKAAGHDRQIQLIAANIDTAFIVTSCNLDFNIARLERYVALALEAEVAPIILITKPDLSANPEDYAREAETIEGVEQIIVLDARGDEPREVLAPWCKHGQTVAFFGSSGVGKSTLANALAGNQNIATNAIREDDAKGRHTTTHRQLHLLPDSCCVIDVPGIREVQLTEASTGIADVFADLSLLAEQCRFADCSHETEPGCAVQEAIQSGAVDGERLERWRKLAAEEQHNNASLAQRRSKDKAFGKIVKAAVKHKKR